MYKQAKQFITQFYTENGYATDEADHRLKQIKREIDLTGTYTLSLEELTYGAQLAWRNSNKCIGRLFWKTLDVIDHQQLIQEEDIFQALFSHIQFATNSGKIRPLITIFSKQVRIWNHQLIRYAGYETEKGIVGDPDSVAFTKICQQLGWKGHGGSFDVLPLVVQVGSNKPVWREISSEIVLEVPIRHPEYQWFTSLGLKWYAVPIISSMKLEIGGHVFPAAPFNGWYMGTEIGARNLADEQRYDQLPIIAEKIGLNCSSASTLWKDRALVELNRAVLYSFKEDRVSIVDHHTAAKQFQQFEKQEAQEGRIVTGNWTWLIPPLSPATTHIFHRPYPNDIVTPNFFYQKAPYENELE